MEKITLDYSQVLNFIDENEIYELQERVEECHDMLHKGTGLGSNYLGWVNLPNDYDREEFKRLKLVAEDIRYKI